MRYAFIGKIEKGSPKTLRTVALWDKNKIINAYLEAPKKGFNTQLMGKDLLYWATIFLNLSKKGLENRDIINKSNKNETKFLNHLEKIIDNNHIVCHLKGNANSSFVPPI